MTDRQNGLDLGSIFLGPKGENADVFERLLLEAFRDHVFWRRNFHPEDGFLVQERRSTRPATSDSISVAVAGADGAARRAEGRRAVLQPALHRPHGSDLTMASLIGYFATMLYNPNNVAAEASPVTTRHGAGGGGRSWRG